MKLDEIKTPRPIRGWIAYMDTGSGEPEAVYAFKDEAVATEYLKGLEKDLDGTDGFAFEVDHVVDGHHLVIHADHKFDSDEFHLLGFHKSRGKLEANIEKQVEDGDIFGIERIEEIEFMETVG